MEGHACIQIVLSLQHVPIIICESCWDYRDKNLLAILYRNGKCTESVVKKGDSHQVTREETKMAEGDTKKKNVNVTTGMKCKVRPPYIHSCGSFFPFHDDIFNKTSYTTGYTESQNDN